MSVLRSIVYGSIDHGSRTPVRDTPAWVTLQVVTGGFATGNFVAGGDLLSHEQELLNRASLGGANRQRGALNSWFLTEPGLALLESWLDDGRYEIKIPEEGALLVVAALLQANEVDAAGAVLQELTPWFDRLRFYPIPRSKSRRFDGGVFVQNVTQTKENLQQIPRNLRILAQKEAVEVWAPFLDSVVALLLESMEDQVPGRCRTEQWCGRARQKIEEYHRLRDTHRLCGRVHRPRGHLEPLMRALESLGSMRSPALSDGAARRISVILDRHVRAHGAPESQQLKAHRERQKADVEAPLHRNIAQAIASRLESLDGEGGLVKPETATYPIIADEAGRFDVASGTPIPSSVRRRVERCLQATVPELIEKDLITSGDVVAQLLPQLTAAVGAGSLPSVQLRTLFVHVYTAFRRRRSLLLLDLSRQVQFEELPWVRALNGLAPSDCGDTAIARRSLEEAVTLVLSAFPQAILPNKLLQELRALTQSAGLKISLTEEIAADIFQGTFTDKYVDAVRDASGLLQNSLYSRYYDIDYEDLLREIEGITPASPAWRAARVENRLGQVCAVRAGSTVRRSVVANGMMIEQQQILTTHNLASLCMALGLTDKLRERFPIMARDCFAWICRSHRQHLKLSWHDRLIQVKRSAYAWRQMVFFLSLCADDDHVAFVSWAARHLGDQPASLQERLAPLLSGLVTAIEGGHASTGQGIAPFLGWTSGRHWLLQDSIADAK